MATKSIAIISGMVDATIKEYQPDVDFKMFRTIDAMAQYLEHNPIRSEILFVTNDVIAGANSSFSYLKDILQQNDYIKIDRVIYITEDDAPELSSLNYLIDEFSLTNWEIVTGKINRSFVQDVINGTQRGDNYDVHRKVVVRKARADYVKERLKTHESLQQEYVDDDHDLAEIPDEEIVDAVIEDRPSIIQKVYISGKKTLERTAFTVLAAQYFSKTNRTLLLESDPEYHTVTEYITKAQIDCEMVTVTEIYNDVAKALKKIRETSKNLVVIGCVDRINFNYRYMLNLLYYNLASDFDRLITECEVGELPADVPVTIVIPSTIIGALEVSEFVDKSMLRWCNFVGVDLKYLSEVHVNSGLVIGKILDDILTEKGIECPIVTISSLRLGDTAYDLGSVFGRGAAV